MTSDELIRRAKEKLAGDGNPLFPPRETLEAIVALGRERDSLAERGDKSKADAAAASNRVAELEKEVADISETLRTAKDDAKEQAWVARELGALVEGIANHQYDGVEAATARRVYDLNSGSLRRKRINAYDYETYEEAWESYVRYCTENGVAPVQEKMLAWMFQTVPKYGRTK